MSGEVDLRDGRTVAEKTLLDELCAARAANTELRIVDDPALAERLACEHSGGQTSAFVAACCDAARRARYEPAVDFGPLRTSP